MRRILCAAIAAGLTLAVTAPASASSSAIDPNGCSGCTALSSAIDPNGRAVSTAPRSGTAGSARDGGSTLDPNGRDFGGGLFGFLRDFWRGVFG